MAHCNHNEPLNCVETVDIFKHLNDEELEAIYMIAKTKNYKKGETIYRSGDHGDALYVIYKGKIRISRLNINGKEQVLRVVGPGDFLGELSLFSDVEHTDNADVIEEATVCTIASNDLKEIVTKNASIALKMLDVMSRRLDKAENTIESINLSNVTQRVSSALLELLGDKDRIELPMNKGDLASQIGTSQESLSRKLSAFQNEGIITMEGQRTIILNDRDALINATYSED